MQNDLIAPTVASLREYFASGQTKAYEWRVTQLQQVKKMLIEQQDKFLQALKQDLNKSELESWSSEIGFVTGDVEHTLKHLKKWMKEHVVSTPLVTQPGKSYSLAEPLGTVLIIGAWNYPVQLVLAPLVAAISAGNCALLKPSELAKNCSALLAKLIPEYLDKQAFAVVEGAVAETTELLKQKFDHIMYTGGEGVARIVMRAAADHLCPVTLELGGKCPCIVDSNTNLEVTAARIVWSKWMNAGQTCVAPDYILVEKAFADELIAALKNKLSEFYGADPKQSADYGRIINSRHFTRLASYLEGQNVLLGGDLDADRNYIAPTLLLNPDAQSAIMHEEIFGPILPIITVDNISDSIGIINQRAKPLALYLYSKDEAFEQQVLSSTSAGNVGINDGMMFMTNPNLPFGGVGNSGMGSYHGQTGFDTFSHLKTVMKRSFMFDAPLRYPPFTSTKLKWLKKLL
jgi:aldehyde dehydrogenase (NAD+)